MLSRAAYVPGICSRCQHLPPPTRAVHSGTAAFSQSSISRVRARRIKARNLSAKDERESPAREGGDVDVLNTESGVDKKEDKVAVKPTTSFTQFASLAHQAATVIRGDASKRSWDRPEVVRSRKDKNNGNAEAAPYTDGWWNAHEKDAEPRYAFHKSDREVPEEDGWAPQEPARHLDRQLDRKQRLANKVMRRKGLKVDTQPLGIGFLGKPGHTIVLRDAPRRKQLRTETISDDAEGDNVILTSMELEEMDEQVDKDNPKCKTKVAKAESRRNIAELLPKDVTEIPQQELEKLVETLRDGFTLSQLEDYVAAWNRGHKKTGNSSRDARDAKAPPYPWIYKISHWQPLGEEKTGGLPGKVIVSRRIVRDCWDLRSIESSQDIGSIEVQLPTHIPKLFQMHKDHFEDFLGPAGEFAFEENQMTVVGTRAQCDAFLEELDKCANLIRCVEKVKIDQGMLAGTLMNQLVDLTKVVLSTNKGKVPTMNVAWVDLGDRPNNVESSKDLFIRLLEQAKASFQRPATTIVDVGRRIMQHRYEGDKRNMSWHNREWDWYRLVATVGQKDAPVPMIETASEPEALESESSEYKASEPELRAGEEGTTSLAEASAQPPPFSSGTILQTVLQDNAEHKKAGDAVDNRPLATPEGFLPLVTSTSTTFGYALTGLRHKTNVNRQLRRLNEVFFTDLKALRYDQCINYGATKSTFATIPPPLPGIASLQSMAPENHLPVKTTATFHFVPHPTTAIPRPAPLELVLSLRPDQHLDNLTWADTSPRLFAIYKTRTSFIHIPHAPVDASTLQTSRWEMDPSTIHANPDLESFVQSFYFNPYTRSLLTRPTLTLRIPPGLFQTPTKPVLLHDPAPKNMSHWKYLFLGMEVRTEIDMPFQGFDLGFASVDAGFHEGRRAEMRLKAGSGDWDAESPEAVRYLEVVRRVAEGKYFPWVGARPVESGVGSGELD